MRLTITLCIFTLLFSSSITGASEPEEDDSATVKQRETSIGGARRDSYDKCAKFIDDIENLGFKADRAANENDPCRAAGHYEKTLRLAAYPPDSCTEYPTGAWCSIVIWKASGIVMPRCGLSAEKRN